MSKKKSLNRKKKSSRNKVILGVTLIAILLFIGFSVMTKSKSVIYNNSLPSPTNTSSNTPIPTRNAPFTSDKTEFISKTGNFAIDYPKEWIIKPYTDKFGETITLYSKQPREGNYMCMHFQIDTNDTYRLKDGETVAKLGNDMKVYRVTPNFSGVDLVRLYLTTDYKSIPDYQSSVVKLPNGKNLLVMAEFNCVEGDINNMGLSVNDQIQSKEYNQALEVIKSIRF